MDALVLAGGSAKGLEAAGEAASKALVEINGKPMLAYILDALKGSDNINRITVTVPSSVRNISCLDQVDRVVNTDGDLAENFYAGLKGVDANDPNSKSKILFVTADIPLLTSQAVDDFIMRCQEIDAGIYYPIISKALIDDKYPQVERTYMTIREGKFTGGNLFLFDRRVASRNKELLREVSSARKSVLKLVRILGPSFIIKFIFHWLTIRELENKISELVGARGVAVPTQYVEVSIDVDKMSDLEMVRAELAKGGRGS